MRVLVLTVMCMYVSTFCVHDVTSVGVRRQARALHECSPPENLEELFTLQNININTSMFLRLARAGERSPVSLDVSIRELEKTLSHNNRTCPTTVSDNPEDPLWARSLCPWYYNVTELAAGHYPRVIPQAVCKCENCVESTLNQCQPITTQIRVLEESMCVDGFIVYQPKLVNHYAGCTCVRRPVRRS